MVSREGLLEMQHASHNLKAQDRGDEGQYLLVMVTIDESMGPGVRVVHKARGQISQAFMCKNSYVLPS